MPALKALLQAEKGISNGDNQSLRLPTPTPHRKAPRTSTTRLPFDIIVLIFDQLNLKKPAVLSSIAVINKGLNAYVTRRLYHTVALETPEALTLFRYSVSPKTKDLVQHLRIQFNADDLSALDSYRNLRPAAVVLGEEAQKRCSNLVSLEVITTGDGSSFEKDWQGRLIEGGDLVETLANWVWGVTPFQGPTHLRIRHSPYPEKPAGWPPMFSRMCENVVIGLISNWSNLRTVTTTASDQRITHSDLFNDNPELRQISTTVYADMNDDQRLDFMISKLANIQKALVHLKRERKVTLTLSMNLDEQEAKCWKRAIRKKVGEGPLHVERVQTGMQKTGDEWRQSLKDYVEEGNKTTRNELGRARA